MKKFKYSKIVRALRATPLSLLLFCSSALMAQNATITNVVIGPTNVTVTYDLTTATPVDITLCYSLDNKCTWDDAIEVSGHITCQTTGTGKTIIWDNLADDKKYGIFYFKIKTELPVCCPNAPFTCEANTFPTPAREVAVPIKVSTTKDATGNWVHEQGGGATQTIYLKFLTYNLGANPCISVKNQMKAEYATSQNDIRVYGGLYQWGRKDATHTFRCAPTPNAASDPRFTKTLISASGTPPNIYINPVDENGLFVWGSASDPLASNSYNWAVPHVDASPLWGNGGGLATQGNTAYTSPQNSQNPCPSGYRVPTEHEWALLGWEGGNSTTATSDQITGHAAVSVARSGLVWVKVRNGAIVTSFAAGSMCGYAIYAASDWTAVYSSTPPDGTDLTLPSAPEPLLFLPTAGFRNYGSTFGNVGTYGHYWSSTVNAGSSSYFYFTNTFVQFFNTTRANSFSVRCIAE